jgi:hypothetical protein
MDIELRLRAGEAHRVPQNTNQNSTSSAEGSLVVRCISCPRPGFNLPADWEKDPQQYVSLLVLPSMSMLTDSDGSTALSFVQMAIFSARRCT